MMPPPRPDEADSSNDSSATASSSSQDQLMEQIKKLMSTYLAHGSSNTRTLIQQEA